MKFKFKNSIGEFIAFNLLFPIVIGLTLGLAFPFWIYWNVRFFIEHTEAVIETKQN